MDIVIGGAKSGKTTEAVTWLKSGNAIGTWPGYSRVVVVPNATELTAFQNTCKVQGLSTDLDKRTFTKAQWDQHAKPAANTVTVLYDNAHEYLPSDAGVITILADGHLKALTNYNIPTA